ncbi:MAG: hypothetical protein ACLGH6_06860 [Gammaproteobacteria bacterium]
MNFSRMTPAERARLNLEMTMRDVLDGLEELASLDAYGFEPGCVEILGIERPAPAPCTRPQPHPGPSAKLLTFPEKRCCAG